jgi:hypothetical protein
LIYKWLNESIAGLPKEVKGLKVLKITPGRHEIDFMLFDSNGEHVSFKKEIEYFNSKQQLDFFIAIGQGDGLDKVKEGREVDFFLRRIVDNVLEVLDSTPIKMGEVDIVVLDLPGSSVDNGVVRNNSALGIFKEATDVRGKLENIMAEERAISRKIPVYIAENGIDALDPLSFAREKEIERTLRIKRLTDKLYAELKKGNKKEAIEMAEMLESDYGVAITPINIPSYKIKNRRMHDFMREYINKGGDAYYATKSNILFGVIDSRISENGGYGFILERRIVDYKTGKVGAEVNVLAQNYRYRSHIISSFMQDFNSVKNDSYADSCKICGVKYFAPRAISIQAFKKGQPGDVKDMPDIKYISPDKQRKRLDDHEPDYHGADNNIYMGQNKFSITVIEACL